MNHTIETFIASKKVSLNTQKSYRYDLQQFIEQTAASINQHTLSLYQQSLLQLKPAAQRRKRSTVNQFLYFLYENGQLERFYKLPAVTPVINVKKQFQKEELSILFEETVFLDGQLIALLIAHLGLTPSEIAGLMTEQVNIEFQVLTVQRGSSRRVLGLPKEMIPYLKHRLTGYYLFDKNGKSYSRQWFFNRLTEYVQSIEKIEWTAQKLREQYILGQLEQGQSLEHIAQQLGLKTMVSLEKFR